MKYFLLLFLVSCASVKELKYTESYSGNKLKLCFLGDTGDGSPNQKAVAELLLKENCHSVHFAGDIIYRKGLRNRHDKNFHKLFWNYYRPVTESGHRPKLYVSLGNHDHDGNIDSWIGLSEKYPAIVHPWHWFFVKINDVCITHFDTDYYRFGFRNLIRANEQMAWLDKTEKDELKDCHHKIAVAHHPYQNSGSHHGHSTGTIRSALQKKIIGKYDYYVAGHEHFLSDEDVAEGTRMLISGAGGRLDSGKGGFLVIEIDGKESRYVFRKVE